MSATNNVVDLGETNAQRLTAIEARVPSDDLPDNSDGGRTIEGRITEDDSGPSRTANNPHDE